MSAKGTGWRKPYASSVFWGTLGVQLALVLVEVVLDWPDIAHGFITTQPLSSQRSTAFFSRVLQQLFQMLLSAFQLSLAVTLR